METSTRRTPQDHLSKSDGDVGPKVPFSFEHGGKTFELAPAADVLTIKFARVNRKLSTIDQFFTIIEAVADKPSLDAIDDMERDEFTQFQKDF